MHDLLWAHTALGIDCGAVVHAPDLSGRAEDGAIRLWQARCLGNLLYAPVSPGFPIWLGRALAEFAPDVLHFHLPNTSAFWALLLPAARRIPWVVHWHADVITPLSSLAMRTAYRAYRPFEQAMLRGAQAVIATSPPYLASSEPLSSWREKCHCIPLGLATDQLPNLSAETHQWAETQWSLATRRVLAIGRLSHYKGFGYLVDAVRHLPEASCLIVGDGEMRCELAAQIASSNAAGRIRLAGRLPLDKLHALIASCEVFCLPSVERTEAFGLVLAEAMAYGKPVVGCAIPGSGVGWVIEDGVNGLLAKPMDGEDLARKIRMALERPEFGVAGLARVTTEFSMERVAERIRGVYCEVLSA
jgi:rhamnosyl/mannosyltransferase